MLLRLEWWKINDDSEHGYECINHQSISTCHEMTVDLVQEDNFYKASYLPLIRLCRRWWKTEQKTSWSPQALGGVPSVTTLIGERILLVLKEKIWNKFKPLPIDDENASRLDSALPVTLYLLETCYLSVGIIPSIKSFVNKNLQRAWKPILISHVGYSLIQNGQITINLWEKYFVSVNA